LAALRKAKHREHWFVEEGNEDEDEKKEKERKSGGSGGVGRILLNTSTRKPNRL